MIFFCIFFFLSDEKRKKTRENVKKFMSISFWGRNCAPKSWLKQTTAGFQTCHCSLHFLFSCSGQFAQLLGLVVKLLTNVIPIVMSVWQTTSTHVLVQVSIIVTNIFKLIIFLLLVSYQEFINGQMIRLLNDIFFFRSVALTGPRPVVI